MLIRKRRGWEIPERDATSAAAYRAFTRDRRRFLSALTGVSATALLGCQGEIGAQELEEKIGLFPPELAAERNDVFGIDGALTKRGPTVLYNKVVENQPETFWNDREPSEYSFLSNVNPNVPHPRWSQARERSIDGSPARATRSYNGYGEWVAGLYA